MTISHKEEVNLTCPACQQSFSHRLWLLLDVQEQPDVAEQAREGNLRRVQCPHCSEVVGWMDAPLLYHDGVQQQLIFSPAEGTSRERDVDDLTQLMERLTTMLPEAEATPYLQRPVIIPGQLLSAYLQGGEAAVEQALDEMWEQSMANFTPEIQDALQALRAAQVESMEQMQAFLNERPELREPLERAGVATTPFQQNLLRFVQAETWSESREILDAHPDLLRPEADTQLARMAEYAHQRGDEEITEVFEAHRDLLERCRLIGVKPAILEKILDLPAGQALQAMNDALDGLLALDAESADELAPVLAEYPYLLSGEAQSYLMARIDNLRASGQEDQARHAEDRLELLAFIQQFGFAGNATSQ